jgi:aminobenzoyl-glutamate utilization protein B
VPLNIIAAIAVKKIMEREHLQGTLRLWPGVAEEEVGAKAYFVKAGILRMWMSACSLTSLRPSAFHRARQ